MVVSTVVEVWLILICVVNFEFFVVNFEFCG